ncbi:NAD-dependent malic enzyme [Kytococcus sp. HMSC28H12]|uniref:NAD-dependent malic enzyme n=1 Tax=Kytococcus sp. HMSC28H12 TaxID=1581067 RepID=UPI0008A1A62C|nr:NAD-dependent malic enzyme [Kytococcus sp. HMSC28H12]OFS13269.1 NAD-dependent malic enzyme [Kytococcus sp. HMSC28H12]
MPRQYQFRNEDGHETVQIAVRGRQVLARPMLNRGSAFSPEDRDALGLRGLIPPAVNTIDGQVRRCYGQFQMQPTNLAKYVYLNSLQDLNEILFHRLVAEHLDEMMPIIYTPTVGEAIQQFSSTFDRQRGIYLSIEDHGGAEGIASALAAYGNGPDDVDIVVVTDSEGILGIGDQGVGGIRIAIGKSAVYTTAAGIHPMRVLPVVLDVGTDNPALLHDPNYLGLRRDRVRGEEYEAFIGDFVEAVQERFPKALLHWEDFGASNAHSILETYRDQVCSFNDDIQGTAAVVVASALAACKAKGEQLSDQRVVIHGAGTAGIGIADLMRDIMISEGLDADEATRRFWGLGSRGLIHTGGRMRPFQERYARPTDELADWQADEDGNYSLAETVRQAKPTLLIGTSAQAGAFTEEIVREMTSVTERPIILPLSNPTAKAEAVPEDLLEWTDGGALIATGSPFKPVVRDEVTYTIAQANNALVFPGMGLGTVAVRATRLTDGMITAAAQAVADMTTVGTQGAAVLPSMRELRSVSAAVAERVAAAAVEEGVATLELDNPRETIANLMWTPEYPEVEVVDSIETPSARPTDPGAQGVRHTGDDSPLSRWRPRLPRLKG